MIQHPDLCIIFYISSSPDTSDSSIVPNETRSYRSFHRQHVRAEGQVLKETKHKKWQLVRRKTCTVPSFLCRMKDTQWDVGPPDKRQPSGQESARSNLDAVDVIYHIGPEQREEAKFRPAHCLDSARPSMSTLCPLFVCVCHPIVPVCDPNGREGHNNGTRSNCQANELGLLGPEQLVVLAPVESRVHQVGREMMGGSIVCHGC